jgi:Mg-chelatase subunit ChlD
MANSSSEYEVVFDYDIAKKAADLLTVNSYTVNISFVIKSGRGSTSNDRLRRETDLIFVLDVSSSMEGERLQAVKDAVKSIIAICTEGIRIAIVTFSNDADTPLAPLTKVTELNPHPN